MRVAHILRKYVPAEWGGTETALQGLSSGLASHGWQSTVYCPSPAGPPTARDPLVESGCEIRRFSACVPVWGISEAARRQMLSVGGNILSFDLPGMLARDRDLDVIHSHVLGRIGGIAATVARRRNLPLVVTIHGGALDLPAHVRQNFAAAATGGFEWGRVFGWWWRARHLLAEADAILSCNQREAELLRTRHPDQRVLVQPHGVATSIYRTDMRAEAREMLPQIVGRDVILSVARIDPVKNQLWLVREFPAVVARHPRALLVLAGACTNAEYGAELQREIDRLGLGQHVLLTGGLPPGGRRVVGLLQEARAFVLPSQAETFGLVILEAWAAGTPVLTTPTSGARELVRDGVNGHFFDLTAPVAFHQALDRLFTDDTHRAQLVAAGYRGADEHDIAVLAGRVRDLYSQLIEEQHALRHSA
jgi:starch synthase